jgi:hypothetical protein
VSSTFAMIYSSNLHQTKKPARRKKKKQLNRLICFVSGCINVSKRFPGVAMPFI